MENKIKSSIAVLIFAIIITISSLPITSRAENENNISAYSTIQPPISERWIYNLEDSKQVELKAICRPRKYSRLFWDPAGNPVEAKSEWKISRTTPFELAVILERPKMESESNSPDGKYYSLYGWPEFDTNNPPAISYVCGIGKWEYVGEVKEDEITGEYYKVTNVTDVNFNDTKRICATVIGNFNSGYVVRLIAVDKSGKEFSMEPGDDFADDFINQPSKISQCASGISKDELSHFKIQRREASIATFTGFAIEPNINATNRENNEESTQLVRWVDEMTGEEFFNINDIVRFDWDKQIFELRREKAIALKAETTNLYRKFKIINNKISIYSGVFVSTACSIGFTEPAIVSERIGNVKIEPPLFKIDNGYPERLFKDVNDLRFSDILKTALKQSNKLADIDINDPPPAIQQ